MSLYEAVFWVALTAAGTGGYFLVETLTRRRLLSAVLTVGGAVGIAYSVYAPTHPGFSLTSVATKHEAAIVVALVLGGVISGTISVLIRRGTTRAANRRPDDLPAENKLSASKLEIVFAPENTVDSQPFLQTVQVIQPMGLGFPSILKRERRYRVGIKNLGPTTVAAVRVLLVGCEPAGQNIFPLHRLAVMDGADSLGERDLSPSLSGGLSACFDVVAELGPDAATPQSFFFCYADTNIRGPVTHQLGANTYDYTITLRAEGGAASCERTFRVFKEWDAMRREYGKLMMEPATTASHRVAAALSSSQQTDAPRTPPPPYTGLDPLDPRAMTLALSPIQQGLFLIATNAMPTKMTDVQVALIDLQWWNPNSHPPAFVDRPELDAIKEFDGIVLRDNRGPVYHSGDAHQVYLLLWHVGEILRLSGRRVRDNAEVYCDIRTQGLWRAVFRVSWTNTVRSAYLDFTWAGRDVQPVDQPKD